MYIIPLLPTKNVEEAVFFIQRSGILAEHAHINMPLGSGHRNESSTHFPPPHRGRFAVIQFSRSVRLSRFAHFALFAQPLPASEFWLLDSPEKVFFAKRTQFQSMFTAFFEKIESQLKPFQSQKKPIQTHFNPI
jgi:hypothetical protein